MTEFSEPKHLFHDEEHGTKILGLEWAPINISLERRLQTFAVFAYVFIFVLCAPISVWFTIYVLFYTKYWWIMVLYLFWMWHDLDKPKQGSRPTGWARHLILWKYLKDYFPVTLHKTVDLDPNRNYIMGIHPHGIISIGAFTNFCTEATDFSHKFPGITSHLMTLVGQFWFPIRRELPLLLGATEVSKESIRYLMTQESKGKAAIIVVGGAMEILEAHPWHYNLNLSRRKGFVKLALQHGADLVPIFSFGENDLFDQVEASIVQKIQAVLKRYTGFPPSLFYGRGIFNYTFGFLPYRRPVHTVIGKPIAVEQKLNPTSEEIVQLHAKYIDGLKEIFETNKKKFGLSDDQKLIIL